MTTAAALRLRFAAAAVTVAVVLTVPIGLAGTLRATQPPDVPVIQWRIPLYRDATARVALATLLAIAAIAIAFLPRYHPHRRVGAANLVTLGRAGLVAWAAGLLAARPDPRIAWLGVGLATVVGVLDGVDGALARRAGVASPFGARFDMEVDAFFVLVLSALVWHHGKAGPWVLGCGLMRYAFVAAGRLLPWLAGPLPPTWRGRAVAVVQFVALPTALGPVVPPPLSNAIAAAALAALTWSFALDVRRLWDERTPSSLEPNP